ncbi:hypothetical protein ACFQ9H_34605 [Streptomyces sp. NPDC056517]|uniref:hypothetical protein n=1 Tax=Streptomyces sp. NPDC056517 TaxID=3345848 RepID=UPI0036C3E857
MARARGTGCASPLPEAMRGLWTAIAAAVCVLLPLAGHLLVQGHLPRWMVLSVLLCGAGSGAVVLSRRRLSDTQLLTALVGAQVAYQAAYAVPGVCAVVGVPDGFATSLGHGAAAGAPPEAFAAGHMITLVLAARLLRVFERFRWQTPPVLTAVVALLRFVWLCCGVPGSGPRPARRPAQDDALPLSRFIARLHAGRAPPRDRRGLTVRAPLLDRAVSLRLPPYALAA